MRFNRITVVAVSTLLAGTCLASPAWAQQDPPPPTDQKQPGDAVTASENSQQAATDQPAPQIDGQDAPADIVVTALRRAQRLIEVPTSITTFTGDEIANRGATSLDQMQASVPGLRIVDIGPGSQRIQLRGISQYLGLPTVGNYVDEFGINVEGASGTPEVRLLDLERIEVLRGPQPALYGEGSMGGTIRYVTASPDLDEVSGKVLGEVSSVKGGEIGFRTDGILNIPLATDVAGLRLAASHEEVPGYTDAVFGKNVNDRTVTTLRGKLLVAPNERLSISLLGLYNNSEQDVKSFSLKNYDTEQLEESLSEQRYALTNLVAAYDFGPVTLLSSTGYMDQKGRSIDDSAKFYNQIFAPIFGPNTFRTVLSDSRARFKRFAQEFRLTSNGDGPFQYLIGASYSNARTTGDLEGNGESLIPGLPAELLGVVFTLDAKTRSRVTALFGNASYDITDRLNIGVGGRYFRDRRSTDSVFTLIGLPVPPSISDDSATFTSFNPRFDLTFKTSRDGIIYANAAKGFRSGGFNQVVDPTTPATFGPEKLWSYEVGTRQGFLANRLLAEAAVYYNDYTDIQAAIVQGGGTVAATRNAGKARGFGVDLTVLAKPQRDLSVSATLGWNNIEFKTQSQDRNPGDPLDLVPKWTWSTAIDYTPTIREGLDLILHADAGYIRKAQITLRNLVPLGFDAAEFTQSRFLVNARAGVSLRNVDIYAFASNLFDSNKIVNPAFGAFFEPIYTRPRTIGIGASGRF